MACIGEALPCANYHPVPSGFQCGLCSLLCASSLFLQQISQKEKLIPTSDGFCRTNPETSFSVSGQLFLKMTWWALTWPQTLAETITVHPDDTPHERQSHCNGRRCSLTHKIHIPINISPKLLFYDHFLSQCPHANTCIHAHHHHPHYHSHSIIKLLLLLRKEKWTPFLLVLCRDHPVWFL